MKEIPRSTHATTIAMPRVVVLIMTLLLATLGCSRSVDMRDQRLVEFANESMTRQAEQNKHIAEQSKAVVQESHQLAEAAKELVELDAEARRELVAAQKELNSQVNEQRAVIDEGRDQLEEERREIAKQRYRDPIVAAAIQNAGLVVACLLPLLVCAFVVWQMQSQEPDDAAVVELLIEELMGDQPKFLPCPTQQPVALDPHAGSRSRMQLPECQDT